VLAEWSRVLRLLLPPWRGRQDQGCFQRRLLAPTHRGHAIRPAISNICSHR
ncbi:hypothetical protein E2562_003413, partial [Oryza meyeriana var. granulata]